MNAVKKVKWVSRLNGAERPSNQSLFQDHESGVGFLSSRHLAVTIQ